MIFWLAIYDFDEHLILNWIELIYCSQKDLKEQKGEEMEDKGLQVEINKKCSRTSESRAAYLKVAPRMSRITTDLAEIRTNKLNLPYRWHPRRAFTKLYKYLSITSNLERRDIIEDLIFTTEEAFDFQSLEASL